MDTKTLPQVPESALDVEECQMPGRRGRRGGQPRKEEGATPQSHGGLVTGLHARSRGRKCLCSPALLPPWSRHLGGWASHVPQPSSRARYEGACCDPAGHGPQCPQLPPSCWPSVLGALAPVRTWHWSHSLGMLQTQLRGTRGTLGQPAPASGPPLCCSLLPSQDRWWELGAPWLAGWGPTSLSCCSPCWGSQLQRGDAPGCLGQQPFCLALVWPAFWKGSGH